MSEQDAMLNWEKKCDGGEAAQFFSKPLVALYILSFVSGISLGIFNPMASTLMKERGFSDFWIGANSTAYFLTLAIGSPIATFLMKCLSIKKIIVSGLMITAITAPFLPYCHQLTDWFVVRVVMGGGVCLYMICGQSLLNCISSKKNRSIQNGIYCLAFGIGFGAGPVVGSQLYGFSPQFSFVCGGVFLALGALVCYLLLPDRKENIVQGKEKVWLLILPALCVIFAYGFAEATLVSVFPVFLMEMGNTVESIGFIFACFVAGSLAFTFPITKLADKFGISITLKYIVAIGAIATYILISQTGLFLYMFSFLAGASLGIIYPLAMAYIGEKLPSHLISNGMGQMTFFFGIGCASGPLLSGTITEFAGIQHVFSATLFVLLAAFISLFISPKETL